MKYLFHGDDQTKSRKLYRACIDREQAVGREIRYLDGAKLIAQDLESVLGTANLFALEAVIIENLCGRPPSNVRKELVKIIKTYSGPKNIILWEKKEISKTIINGLAQSGEEVQSFLSKTPAVIFKFLDSVVPGNSRESIKLMHASVAAVDEGFVFVMLSRQVAELLIASSGETASLNPWKKSRLIAQAHTWDEPDLIRFHKSLLSIDRAIKTGTTKLSYLDHLDILIINLMG